MADYSKVPSGATLQVKPFKAHVDEKKLQQLKDLIKLSPIGPPTFENTNNGRRYGTQREWLTKAKQHWETQFDWRKSEDRINSYPNFTAHVKDGEGVDIEVHFIGLFSERQDAVPLAFFHGWPGSFLEFLDILDLIKQRYSPKELPYHIIVPSLPGYGYSSSPPLDRDYDIVRASDCLDKLMTGLGFSSYLAQGGDLGSFICRVLSTGFDACKGCHFFMVTMQAPQDKDTLKVDEVEAKALPRGTEFRNTGFAYALEHGTRTGTIGLALSASPLALLSWIGEKFLEWTDQDPPLEQILESVTLYWLTDTFPRGIYPYRGQTFNTDDKPLRASPDYIAAGGQQYPYVTKPTGYSFFPKELFPMPVSWVNTVVNLVSSKRHDTGGHFAAMEKPKELLADVEDWVPKAWNYKGGKL